MGIVKFLDGNNNSNNPKSTSSGTPLPTTQCVQRRMRRRLKRTHLVQRNGIEVGFPLFLSILHKNI